MDPDQAPVPPDDIPTLTEEAPPLVPMGQSMPDSQRVPTLLPQAQAVPEATAADAARVSTLGEGLSFVGSITSVLPAG